MNPQLFRPALVAASLLLGGCQSLSRISTCSNITDGTNSALGEIAEVYGTEEQELGADAYSAISQKYRALDLHLGQIDLSTHKDLSAAVEAYRSSLRTMARESERYEQNLRKLEAAQGASDSIASGVTRTLGHARKNMGKFRATYEVTAERIERLCAVR